jgi:hypothetical protein
MNRLLFTLSLTLGLLLPVTVSEAIVEGEILEPAVYFRGFTPSLFVSWYLN